MKAPAFAYVRPASRGEALDLLARYGADARILAGGQSLMPALNMRLAAPRVLVDIGSIAELAGIRVTDGALVIGALARHAEVERSPDVARHVPLLRQALPHVAHVAIRNRGTFGGSIAFADPAAELPACCLALDATFVIANAGGERRVGAQEFFKGPYETDLRPGEILVAGRFPLRGHGYRCAFGELARRHGDYAIVGLAAHARQEGEVLAEVRLAYFGVGAAPVLARHAAAAVEGGTYSAARLKAAQAALGQDLDPYDDVHHSGAAKLHLARVLTGRVLGQLAGGA